MEIQPAALAPVDRLECGPLKRKTWVMSTDVRVVFYSCPDQDIADSIAARLVEENLAACVNILPGNTTGHRRSERDPGNGRS